MLFINGVAMNFGLIHGAMQSESKTAIGMMNSHQDAFVGSMFQFLVGDNGGDEHEHEHENNDNYN